MEGSFVKGSRQCDLTMTKTVLKCVLKNNFSTNVKVEVNLSDILAVQTVTRDTNLSSVIVHYAARKKDKQLTWKKLVLAAEPRLCKELKDTFSVACPDRDRPKHFLVLINPYSGKKAAGRIFHKKVAPLFRACGITFKVYETTGPNDAMTAFQDIDLSTLQGVICVGGDGTYSEMITALVKKQQHHHQVNADDPNSTLVPVHVPVGFIPGGSGNFLPMYLHGCRDPITAAIKIILGKTTATNIASVHLGNKLVRFSSLVAGFGLLGDMMHLCERYRWMGNVRYKVLPVKSMLSRRLIDAVVSYVTDGSGEWHTCRGPFYSVEVNVVNLADKEDKLVPLFGEPALTLHMTSTCALGDHIKQLSKVAEWTSGAYDFDFVRNEKVLRYHVDLSSLPTSKPEDGEERLVDSYYINLDGEPVLVDKPSLHVRLHAGIINIFGEHP